MDKPTVQDIFHRFYPAYLDQYSPSPVQAKVAHNIMNCKTGAYGANVCVCEDCGFIQIHYNSCRNRCCPIFCSILTYCTKKATIFMLLFQLCNYFVNC